MSDWTIGYLLGIATGLAVGLFFPRGQESWSELSSTSRIIRIALLVIAIGLLVTGIVTMLIAS